MTVRRCPPVRLPPANPRTALIAWYARFGELALEEMRWDEAQARPRYVRWAVDGRICVCVGGWAIVLVPGPVAFPEGTSVTAPGASAGWRATRDPSGANLIARYAAMLEGSWTLIEQTHALAFGVIRSTSIRVLGPSAPIRFVDVASFDTLALPTQPMVIDSLTFARS